MVIDHLDGNKLNNRLDNLEVISQRRESAPLLADEARRNDKAMKNVKILSVSVPPEIYSYIEQHKGEITRSRFVVKLLKKQIEKDLKNEEVRQQSKQQ